MRDVGITAVKVAHTCGISQQGWALAAGRVRQKGNLRREGKEREGKECKWWLHKSRTEAITWLKALCSKAAVL